MAADSSAEAQKLLRLSLACNQCRKRKVRCDARLPKCRNCSLRGENCETNDLRKPGHGPGVRRRATKSSRPRDSPAPSSAGHSSHARSVSVQSPDPPVSMPQMSPASTAGRPPSSRANRSPPNDAMQSSPPDHELPGESLSWVSRGYLESNASQPVGEEHSDVHTIAGVTPDVLVNTDDTPHRIKFMGASSSQCLFTFVDLHLAHLGFPPASPIFRHGMAYSEEFSLPLSFSAGLPELPPHHLLNTPLEAYFARVWPLFPAVQRHTLSADISRLLTLQHSQPEGLQRGLASTDVPILAIIYATLCIGMDELQGSPSEESTKYLTACYGLMSHILAVPYISSVQALILLALALRGRAKDGQAWQVLGQAIRMAHSLGLHKHTTGQPARPGTDGPLYRRLWWSCHSMEKMMQLETGRPSITTGHDSGLATPHTEEYHHPTTEAIGEHFEAWTSLAQIMGQISERVYQRKFSHSGEMFGETARLDQILLDWQRNLPDHLKPGGHDAAMTDAHDPETDRTGSPVLNLFLSLQFHHAQLALLRVSLLFPHQSFIAEVKKRAADIPTPTSRLASGAVICAAAARETVTQLMQLADQGIKSSLLGVNQVLLATVVLALGILRQPGKRLARSDVELLYSATEYIEDYYTRWGQDVGFVQLSAELRERMTAVVQRHGRGSGEGMTVASSTGSRESLPPMGIPVEAGPAVMGDFHGHDVNMDLFGELEFEHFWNMLDSDFLVG